MKEQCISIMGAYQQVFFHVVCVIRLFPASSVHKRFFLSSLFIWNNYKFKHQIFPVFWLMSKYFLN